MADPLHSAIGVLESAGFAVDAESLADALWLAQFFPHVTALPVPTPVVLPPPVVEANESPRARPAEEAGASPEVKPAADVVSPEVDDRGLYADTAGAGEGPPVPASAVRVPGAPALPGTLALGRALRPFRTRRPNPGWLELDEEATVDALHNLDWVLPLFRARPERWFEVSVVVEDSPAMDVWRQTVRELVRLLQRQGAFRDVRCWWLRTQPEPRLMAGPDAKEGGIRPAALCDPSSRRLIFFFTHGAAEHWRAGVFGQLLKMWGRTTPVVILHALPQHLWKRTPLGEAGAVAKTLIAGVSNSLLEVERAWWDKYRPLPGPHFAVPVTPLEPDALARWAEMLMARGGATSPAMLVRTTAAKGESRAAAEEKLTPEQRVQRFRSIASPEAYRLAVHVAAAPMTLPVMRLLQSAILKDAARQTQLAELMLSGLIERVTPASADVSPELVQYRFVAGAGDVLLRSLREESAFDVVRILTEHIEREFGSAIDFKALVRDEDGQFSLPAQAQPFAEAGVRLLDWMRMRRPVARPVRANVGVLLLSDRPEGVAQWERWYREHGVSNIGTGSARVDVLRLMEQAEAWTGVSQLYFHWIGPKAGGGISLSSVAGMLSRLPIANQIVVAEWQDEFSENQMVEHMSRPGGRKIPTTQTTWRGPSIFGELAAERWFREPAAVLAELEKRHPGAAVTAAKFDPEPAERVLAWQQPRGAPTQLREAVERAGYVAIDGFRHDTCAIVIVCDGGERTQVEKDWIAKSLETGVKFIYALPPGAEPPDDVEASYVRLDDFEVGLHLLLEQLAKPNPPYGALHGVPPLPPHHIARDATLRQLDRRLAHGETLALALTGHGRRTVAASFARKRSTRLTFPGGIYWDPVELERSRDGLRRLVIDTAGDISRYGDEVVLTTAEPQEKVATLAIPSLTSTEAHEYFMLAAGPEAQSVVGTATGLASGDIRKLALLAAQFRHGSATPQAWWAPLSVSASLEEIAAYSFRLLSHRDQAAIVAAARMPNREVSPALANALELPTTAGLELGLLQRRANGNWGVIEGDWRSFAVPQRLVEAYGRLRGEREWWEMPDDGHFYTWFVQYLHNAGLVDEAKELLFDYRWLTLPRVESIHLDEMHSQEVDALRPLLHRLARGKTEVLGELDPALGPYVAKLVEQWRAATQTGKRLRLFLSHADEDTARAREFAALLSRDADVVSRYERPPDARWEEWHKEELQQADACVALRSRYAFHKSKACHFDMEMVAKTGKTVVSVDLNPWPKPAEQMAPTQGRAPGTNALVAILVCPDRRLAKALASANERDSAFRIAADLDAYPEAKALEERIHDAQADLVLMDVSSDLQAAIRLIHAIEGRPQVVSLHRRNEPEAILSSLRAGAAEFMCEPFDTKTLDEALRRAKPKATLSGVNRLQGADARADGVDGTDLARAAVEVLARLTGGPSGQRENRRSAPWSALDWEKVKQEGARENLAAAYEQYVRDWPERAAAQDLAWPLHNNKLRGIRGLEPVPSYLKQESAGDCQFAHISLQEYFVALRIEKLLRGEPGELPERLTDGVVSFLPDLLADYVHPVERSADGRMVRVPVGPFVYGKESERNLTIAIIAKPFWMDRYPVTNAEYCHFLNETRSRFSKWLGGLAGGSVGKLIDLSSDRCRIAQGSGEYHVKEGWDEHPVTCVSWFGASAYAEWAGKMLPQEQQWEKAARGVDGRLYPFGRWDESRCNTMEAGPSDTTPYAKYDGHGDSPYGCLDMAGNVWEWMNDAYLNGSENRVLKGGSWNLRLDYARCPYRENNTRAFQYANVGFRCASVGASPPSGAGPTRMGRMGQSAAR